MGEARRRRQAAATCPVEEAPNLPGHIRLTMLDDDDIGCSVYVELTELLEEMSRLEHQGRPLAELGATLGGWARLRAAAFDMARDVGNGTGPGLMMLWCVMHGPAGAKTRRAVSTMLAKHGQAALMIRRDRLTQGCVLTLGVEAGNPIPVRMAREAGQHLKGGTVLVRNLAAGRRREDA
jgi:hypothetical protein